LVVRTRQSDHRLQAGTDYRLGRDPASDIVINDARVSWAHAVIRHEQDVWILEDAGSTNGTFVGTARVDRITISADCVLRLGNADDGPVLRCEPAARPVPAPTQVSGPSAAGLTTVLTDPPGPVRDDAAPVLDDPAPVRGYPTPARIDQPVTPEVRPAKRDDQPPVRNDRPAARFTPAAERPAPPLGPPGQRPSGPSTPSPSGGAGTPAGPPNGRSGTPGTPGRPATPQVPDDYRLSVDRRPTAVLPLPTSRMRIGRTDDNDLVLSDLSVSKHHAELRKTSDGKYQIADLGSHNGTFVNGQRVTSATLSEKDIVGIGHATFRLTDGELREYIDTGDVSLVAQDLVVEVSGGKILLDHVSFPLGERNLVGIIGPSGAGKSTLLGALTGMRPADRGVVLYDNRDLYKDYDELRTRIGLVPQDSVMHTQLTTQRALQYGAELRFPPDTGSDERNGRVDEVMGELGLTRHADTRADRLSGGQLKRVNVALELLTKPSLLFLDEPTSGLDPGLDKSVMEQMADLAHDGRTVIVVTHSVANLNVCDRLLVLVPGGRVAFFGPPGEGLAYFGEPGWAEVFQTFEREPNRDWATEFKASRAHDEYVTRPQAMSAVSTGPKAAGTPAPVRGGGFHQLGTLVRRYTRVLASDRAYVLSAVLLPFILGGLIYLVAGSQGLRGSNAAMTLIMLIVGVSLSSTISSIFELLKERNIYVRERAAGLSSGAYLGSKLIVLGVISVVQALIVAGIGLAFRPLPAQGSLLTSAPFPELLIGVAVFAVASMCLGLAASALVRTINQATPFLVLIIFIQIMLSGGVFAVSGAGINQISWLIPGRWGYAAVASTASLNHLLPAGSAQINSLWDHQSSTWLTDIGAMIVLSIVFVLIAWWRLNRLSPGRRK
jgi:ABC-type multidrug transport system ATPase subunit/pSer/pThr/pTyr-binding forkhead associated (FHA) protein